MFQSVKQFILKYLPYLAIIILCLIMFKNCSDHNAEMNGLKSNLSISKDSVKYLRGKNGELVNRVLSVELDNKSLKEQGELLGISNKELKKKIGSQGVLIAYYKGAIETSGKGTSKGKDTTIYITTSSDTSRKINAKKFSFNNGYLKLNQIYNPLTDSLSTNYDYKVDFELLNYRSGRKFLFLGKRELIADVRLSDPNAKMTDVKSVVIKPPPKKWYQTNLFKYGVGFLTGSYLMSR